MSYYRIFTPTDKIIAEMREKVSTLGPSLETMKNELCIYCMQKHDTEPVKIISVIFFKLNCIKLECESLAFKYALEQFKENGKEIYFCGNEYSHDSCHYNIDETMNDTSKCLAVLKCIVDTPDWFDEYEKFYKKQSEIEQIIDDFVDTLSIYADYKVIDMLKDCENPDDDYVYYKRMNNSDIDLIS